MDDFVARRDLLPATELGALSVRSDAAGGAFLLRHALALAASGWWVWTATGSWLLLPAWLVHGVLLNFLFAPLHESIHSTAFRSRWLNRVVAELTGLALLLPPRYFRWFHFAHHRHTQDPERDPELATPKPTTPLAHLWFLTGLGSYWWPQTKLIAEMASGRVRAPFIPRSAHREVIGEARRFVVIYVLLAGASLLTGTTALLVLWLVPALLGGPALRLFLHAEHGGCPLVEDMLANTRTTLTHPLLRAFTWNMSYHVEHHLYPAVPFHALPRVHGSVAGRHEVLCDGYTRYHRDVLAHMRSVSPAQPAGRE